MLLEKNRVFSQKIGMQAPWTTEVQREGQDETVLAYNKLLGPVLVFDPQSRVFAWEDLVRTERAPAAYQLIRLTMKSGKVVEVPSGAQVYVRVEDGPDANKSMRMGAGQICDRRGKSVANGTLAIHRVMVEQPGQPDDVILQKGQDGVGWKFALDTDLLVGVELVREPPPNGKQYRGEPVSVFGWKSKGVERKLIVADTVLIL